MPEKFGLPLTTIDSLNSVFEKYDLISEVIIYGSRSVGTFKPGSDIDLTIKGTGLGTTELLAIENQIEDLLIPYKVDLSLFQQIENKDLVDHVSKFGKPFYLKK